MADLDKYELASKVLFAASISASSILSGFLVCLSYVSIPAILQPKDVSERTLLSLWRAIYFKGFHLSPPLAILSGAGCMANSFIGRMNGSGVASSRMFVAGLCMAGVIPYTIFFVAPTNRVMMGRLAKLESPTKTDKTEGATETQNLEESRRLVGRWAVLNYGRFALPFVGSLLAWTVY